MRYSEWLYCKMDLTCSPPTFFWHVIMGRRAWCKILRQLFVSFSFSTMALSSELVWTNLQLACLFVPHSVISQVHLACVFSPPTKVQQLCGICTLKFHGLIFFLNISDYSCHLKFCRLLSHRFVQFVRLMYWHQLPSPVSFILSLIFPMSTVFVILSVN